MTTAEQRRSACSFVVNAWKQHSPVCVCNTTNWHKCNRHKCCILHLKTYVCLCETPHACSSSVCEQHPMSPVVLVDNVYACKETGMVHECVACNQKCTVENGLCVISGKPTSANDVLDSAKLHLPTTNKRCRRRRASGHTNHQIACILIFDLLFSRRRRMYESSRRLIYRDIARRQGVKYVRTAAKDGQPLILQNLVDIFVTNKDRLRPVDHLFDYTSEQQKDICRKYATVIYRVWLAFASSMSRRVTFDAGAAALLYHMRRGLALDGMNVVPMDPFLFKSLPGKFCRCPFFESLN